MSGQFLLDTPVLSLSLFNTILLTWLGLTVLLNAERRTWAIWLAGGGLLLGGTFFVSHSAIYAQGLRTVSAGMTFWWLLGWAAVAALPFTWYVLALWYAGYWDDPSSPLHRRQRPWFLGAAALGAGLVGLLVFANPFPSYSEVVQLAPVQTPGLGGLPLLALVYPVYIVLCISLSLDVLRRPAPSGRVMGDLARRRARPWLAATAVALLAASLLVAWVVLWVASSASRRPGGADAPMELTLIHFDRIIVALIAVATLLLGQAIVSYEIFTGATLPRRGLRRHWRTVVLLALGYSLLVGGSLSSRLRPIYGLLLATALMTASFALLSWRAYGEREQSMARLRPFVASLGLYDHLLVDAATAPPDVDVTILFRALADDILGARSAYLAALGPLAPLAGVPLAHPAGVSVDPSALFELAAGDKSPQTLCVPLDARRYGGATWGVPLWSERGLIGVLLLGEKRDGGLYTQEEIEIARASGERLIDTQASAEMARRLMALQRERLAESQILDGRTRRVLHDDVLPRLHAAILELSGPAEAAPDAVAALTDAHRGICDLLRELPSRPIPELARQGLVAALRQVVDQELAGAFDRVTWEVDEEGERLARAIPPRSTEVVFYAAREVLRNAAHHGRGGDASRALGLRLALSWHDGLQLLIEDSGVGLGPVGRPGPGSGQGLALHSTMMAVIGGSLTLESLPGAYTRAVLSLPG